MLLFFSTRVCAVFDHFGYGHPPYDSWFNLIWYSLDRTLQWLSSQRVKLNPEGCVPHIPCYQEMDAITIPLARASITELHGLHRHPSQQVSSTHSTPASSSTPSASELAESGGTISSSPPSTGPIFVTSDDDEPAESQLPSKETSQSPSPKIKSSLKMQGSLKRKQQSTRKPSPFKTPSKVPLRRSSSSRAILKVKWPITTRVRPSQMAAKPLPDPDYNTPPPSTSPPSTDILSAGKEIPPPDPNNTKFQNESDSETEPQHRSSSDSSDMEN